MASPDPPHADLAGVDHTGIDLTGKRVAFLLTNGFEDSELESPWDAVSQAGASVVLVSPVHGAVKGKNGHRQPVDVAVTDASADDFDGLVLPGGVVKCRSSADGPGGDRVHHGVLRSAQTSRGDLPCAVDPD